MVDAVIATLVVSSLIIIIGFLANHFFNQTGLPDLLILIFLGIVFGPIFGVFDPEAIKSFAPYVAALALALILFDGGVGLNIHEAMSHSPRAVLLAVLSFILSVIGVAAFTKLLFDVPLLYAILFGCIFGGSSSVAVIAMVSKVKACEKSSTVLILESAITDILCIVISLAIIDIIITGQVDYGAISLGIAGKFLIGVAVGIAFGIAWLFALKKAAPLPFSYMLTVGMVLLGYAISEILGGSGALSALLFGLILGNELEIFKAFRRKKDYGPQEKIFLSVSKGLKRFETEIAFLIRTFFFVFLGIIFSVSSLSILFCGIIISLVLLGSRFGAVYLSTIRCPLKNERPIMTVVLTRGLAAAVLATLPLQYGLDYSDLFINVSVIVIIATAIIATVGSALIARQQTQNRVLKKLAAIKSN